MTVAVSRLEGRGRAALLTLSRLSNSQITKVMIMIQLHFNKINCLIIYQELATITVQTVIIMILVKRT